MEIDDKIWATINHLKFMNNYYHIINKLFIIVIYVIKLVELLTGFVEHKKRLTNLFFNSKQDVFKKIKK